MPTKTHLQSNKDFQRVKESLYVENKWPSMNRDRNVQNQCLTVCEGMEEAILFLDPSLNSGSSKVGVKEEMCLTSKCKHSFADHYSYSHWKPEWRARTWLVCVLKSIWECSLWLGGRAGTAGNSACPPCIKAWVRSLTHSKPNQTEGSELEIQGHPWLLSKFKASLGY